MHCKLLHPVVLWSLTRISLSRSFRSSLFSTFGIMTGSSVFGGEAVSNQPRLNGSWRMFDQFYCLFFVLFWQFQYQLFIPRDCPSASRIQRGCNSDKIPRRCVSSIYHLCNI
jgi:hypothetical protein